MPRGCRAAAEAARRDGGGALPANCSPRAHAHYFITELVICRVHPDLPLAVPLTGLGSYRHPARVHCPRAGGAHACLSLCDPTCVKPRYVSQPRCLAMRLLYLVRGQAGCRTAAAQGAPVWPVAERVGSCGGGQLAFPRVGDVEEIGNAAWEGGSASTARSRGAQPTTTANTRPAMQPAAHVLYCDQAHSPSVAKAAASGIEAH